MKWLLRLITHFHCLRSVRGPGLLGAGLGERCVFIVHTGEYLRWLSALLGK